jgi:hypothetical protein
MTKYKVQATGAPTKALARHTTCNPLKLQRNKTERQNLIKPLLTGLAYIPTATNPASLSQDVVRHIVDATCALLALRHPRRETLQPRLVTLIPLRSPSHAQLSVK